MTSITITPSCLDPTRIGLYCNISNTPCDIMQPCQNNASCNNVNTTSLGYICSCPAYFNGTQCQFDYRPCQPNTCWNNGECNATSNLTFICLCQLGWQDSHCQTKVNYCENIRCLNNGVCRPLLRDYTCECLGDSYSGRHCEITASKTVVHQVIAKSFASVAIIAMISTAIFIITMDVIKYYFGIDLTYEELKRLRQRKQKIKENSTFTLRFMHVNSPLPVRNEDLDSIVEETAV